MKAKLKRLSNQLGKKINAELQATGVDSLLFLSTDP